MQFEVARNNAERTLQNAQANLNASQFNLNNLLHQQNNADLSTPLFVNTVRSQSLESLLSSYSQKSSLVQNAVRHSIGKCKYSGSTSSKTQSFRFW